jgi:RNA polymerase-binding transcription factor DksA
VDVIDVAQRRQQEEIDQVLANRRVLPAGLTHCEMLDCGEPISAMRQQMGARLCVDCATAKEQEARRWAPRAHG